STALRVSGSTFVDAEGSRRRLAKRPVRARQKREAATGAADPGEPAPRSSARTAATRRSPAAPAHRPDPGDAWNAATPGRNRHEAFRVAYPSSESREE